MTEPNRETLVAALVDQLAEACERIAPELGGQYVIRLEGWPQPTDQIFAVRRHRVRCGLRRWPIA